MNRKIVKAWEARLINDLREMMDSRSRARAPESLRRFVRGTVETRYTSPTYGVEVCVSVTTQESGGENG